jgi:hypothetical protein
LEDWQKFELVVALKLADKLSAAVGEELVLRPIQQGSDRPIATFGQYDVYWQSRTRYQMFPDPEPSEVVTQGILQSYGIPVGADRPDIVICDRVQEIVVAIAEAKFSKSVSSWKDAFRDATAQLVRYSRLYEHRVPQGELLRRSVIAVANLPEEIRSRPTPGTAPVAVGLPDLLEGSLTTWISRVTSSCSEASATSSRD